MDRTGLTADVGPVPPVLRTSRIRPAQILIIFMSDIMDTLIFMRKRPGENLIY